MIHTFTLQVDDQNKPMKDCNLTIEGSKHLLAHALASVLERDPIVQEIMEDAQKILHGESNKTPN